MARRPGRARSSVTGRFVRRSTARRHPSRTVVHGSFSSGRSSRTVARSASTGRFVSRSYAKRHPNVTIVQTIKR